jgi:hypothetical protein
MRTLPLKDPIGLSRSAITRFTIYIVVLLHERDFMAIHQIVASNHVISTTKNSQWCRGLYTEAYIRYIAVDPRKTSKL